MTNTDSINCAQSKIFSKINIKLIKELEVISF